MENVLRLTLKRKWYEQIKSGEKKIEYREIKKYWLTRISNAAPIREIHFYHGYPPKGTPPLVKKLKYIKWPPHTKDGLIELHLED